MLPLPIPPSRGSSASPPGTDSGGRGGGGRLHSSPAGRCCARTGDRRLPGARGAGMELFQAKDHYILQQGERALWCSRRDGGLQLRPGEALKAGWVGRADQLERCGGGAARAPPEQRLGGWAGRLEMSAPVLRGAAASLARTPVSVRRERPVPPFSLPPPVSGAWGVGTGSLRKPLQASTCAGFAPSSAGKFWVRIPCSSVEALAGLSLLTSLYCSRSLIKE